MPSLCLRRRLYEKVPLAGRCWLLLRSLLLMSLMTGCESLSQLSQRDLKVTADAYCATYQKIVRARGEGNINATKAVKQRILANELTYKCLCEGFADPVCSSGR